MTNTAANAIVALRVGSDGLIAGVGSVTSTAGIGGSLVNPTTFAPNGPDALGSQGSVTVQDNVSLLLKDHSSILTWSTGSICCQSHLRHFISASHFS
jgi:hypothetical protein